MGNLRGHPTLSLQLARSGRLLRYFQMFMALFPFAAGVDTLIGSRLLMTIHASPLYTLLRRNWMFLRHSASLRHGPRTSLDSRSGFYVMIKGGNTSAAILTISWLRLGFVGSIPFRIRLSNWELLSV